MLCQRLTDALLKLRQSFAFAWRMHCQYQPLAGLLIQRWTRTQVAQVKNRKLERGLRFI